MSPNSIPWLLIGWRAACAPILLALAALDRPWSGAACAAVLSSGVLSDIFDGVVARRLGVATPGVRTLDSRVDVLFWVSVAASVLLLRPELWTRLAPLIAVIAAMEVLTHLVSFARFRREASPHHLTSKLFGLALWALAGVWFWSGQAGPLYAFAFALGVAAQLEALAITLILPSWRTDVKGVGQALALRRPPSG